MEHPPIHVLVIDTDDSSFGPLNACLGKCGFSTKRVVDAEAAPQAALKDRPDLVLVNLEMAGADALRVCRLLKSDPRTLQIPIACITPPDNHTVNSMAVEAGVSVFLTKPVNESILKAHFPGLFRIVSLSEDLNALRYRLDLMGEYHRRIAPGRRRESRAIIGESPVMRQIIEKVAELRDLDSPVFLVGESSTGKHLLAEAMHWDGRRAAWPFVHVDCSEMARSAVEHELFGCRGTSGGGTSTGGTSTGDASPERTFTDENPLRKGLVEIARGGTLFVSGLDYAPPAVMDGLLGIVDSGLLGRSGRPIQGRAGVRMILSATFGSEVSREVRRFYHNLLRHADVVTIEAPPLRERGGDIALLARYFLSRCTRGEGREKSFSGEVMRAFDEYHWPGNVGELQRAVERAVVYAGARESVTLRCLPPEVSDALKGSAAFPGRDEAAPRGSRPRKLVEIEEEYIKEILKREKGNRTRAALALGISRSTMKRKIAENPALEDY